MVTTDLTIQFIIRLAVAGLLGAVIGLDREDRAKEAGTRTHFLVSLGSALIIIVSQWGFGDVVGHPGIGLDPSRVAAQVVSGIGFIGAGTIMMQKQFVRGLTTAAGLWATAGIGLAIGGGLYTVGIAATLLTLIGLEALRYLLRNFRSKCSIVKFVTRDRSNLIRITNELNSNGFSILTYAVNSDCAGECERLRVTMNIREKLHNDENQLTIFMQQFEGIEIEKIE